MRFADFPYQARVAAATMTGGFARAGRNLASRIDWGNLSPGEPTLLCMDRSLFSKDLAEIGKRSSLNLARIRATAIKHPQEKWVAPRWQQQAHFWHYLNTDLSALRPRLEEFGAAFLTAASATHPIDAVVAANTDYWQDEALRLGCRKLGIPFIALSRESYGIGRGRDFVANNYKSGNFYFNGAACAVASQTCVDFMQGQAAMRDARVLATGWPRYDAWRDYPAPPIAARKWITVMAYGDPKQVQYAAENFRDVMQVIINAAERQLSLPEPARVRFIIKMKKKNADDYVQAILPDPARLGIEIVVDTPIPELATQSRMIIGFNTLAVLEGLLGGGAVVVPVWGDADRGVASSLLHPDNPADAEVCYFPRSAAEFASLLDQSLAGQLPAKGSESERLARFSRHSLMEADRTASARFETFVRSILADKAA
jgi:hypothetical protein